jgi:hypothetical protein
MESLQNDLPTPAALTGERARPPVGAWIAGGLLLCALGVLLWGLNMRRGLNHDEHQFIAGAALMARDGLSPYVDFPSFHMPLLSQAYALRFRFSPTLLLTARAVSVVSAWVTLGLLLWLGYRVLPRQNAWLRLLHGAAGALLLAFTPLFVYTSGRAWNHDLPALLTIIAIINLIDGMARPSTGRVNWHAVIAGLMLGLAIITRASFALLIPGFLAGFWIGTPGSSGQRAQNIAWFALGGVLGALPALLLLARDPQAFLFGNLTYVQLNTLYYQSQAGDYPGMTLSGKLAVFAELMVRQLANLLPLLAFAGTTAWAWLRGTSDQRRQLAVLILLVLLALAGALAATPVQTQYFYILLPLAVLGTLYAVGMWPYAQQRWGVGAVAGAALISLLLTGRAYAPGLAIVAQPDEWIPRKIHARGELIAGLVGTDSPVLTLSPIHILEGGLPIYPAFATGPFAWRVADLVDPATRADRHLVGPSDLEALLIEPPRALLTGLDNDDKLEEAPLVAYAEENRYLPVSLPDDGTLWLSPLADWGGLVQLGAVHLPQTPLLPGEETVVTLYLQALTPMAQDFNLLVRLVDAAGEELWRADGWPYGAPTSAWAVGDVRPDGYTVALPADSAPGLYKLEASLYDPATLDPVGAPVTAGVLRVGEPLPAGLVQATFGDSIQLHDAQVSVTPDGLAVDLLWQADARPPTDLVRFVQVLDDTGQVVAQQDGSVMNGFLPTQDWPLGWPIRDQVTLAAPVGDYTVITGFYDAATQTRLPVSVGGKAAGDHVVVSGSGK